MNDFDYEDFELEIFLPGNDSEFEYDEDRLSIEDGKTNKQLFSF